MCYYPRQDVISDRIAQIYPENPVYMTDLQLTTFYRSLGRLKDGWKVNLGYPALWLVSSPHSIMEDLPHSLKRLHSVPRIE